MRAGLLAVVAAACAPIDRHAFDAAEINDAVPAELRGPFSFYNATIRFVPDGTMTGTIPSGWLRDPDAVITPQMSLEERDLWKRKLTLREPTNGHELFELGMRCSWQCRPEQWGSIVDMQVLARYRKHDVVLLDRATASERRFMSVAPTGQIHYVRAWWRDGDDSYHLCRGWLDAEHAGLALPLMKACATLR